VRTRILRILLGIATVLVFAGVGYVLRGAVFDKRATARVVVPPGVAPANGNGGKPDRFTLRAAGRNVVPKGASVVATARGRSLRVRARPKSKRSKLLRQRRFNGQRIPLTFLVRSRRRGWVRVDLPTRPNQSRGWVRRKDVDLSFTRLRVEIRTKTRRLRLLDNKRVISSAKIGVGRSLSPTPPGRYYVTDIIRAKNPKGFYGPYALGLSAHSPVYTSFAGGNGQIGIHGTNVPSSVGTEVSAGCVRVTNDVITGLAKRVPLGTPVVIRS